MKTCLHLLILLVVIICSCKKDDTGIRFTLPAKTLSGQNTFGFLLNAAVWTNYGQVCIVGQGACRENLEGAFYTDDGDTHIIANRIIYKNGSWNTRENIDLYLKTNLKGVQNYSTLTNDYISVYYWFSERGNTKKTYLLSRSNPSFNITINKIDTINKIISGEFYGKLFRRISDTSFATSATDSIILEDGRFDIKLK